ncbi:MAG: hypothetical protein J6J36_06450 [Clostridia bacterium]|nr:hypothetical protein [Clostridia bacterium]
MMFVYKNYQNSFLATFMSMVAGLLYLAAVLVIILGVVTGSNISEIILYVVGGICFGISGFGLGKLAKHIAIKKEENINIESATSLDNIASIQETTEENAQNELQDQNDEIITTENIA